MHQADDDMASQAGRRPAWMWTRITTALLHELRRRGARRAAAAMCIGVGQGIATLWEAP